MITLLVHVNNSEPIKLDVEQMPTTIDQVIIGKNPRERTDREVTWIDEGVTTIIVPWWRITFIEVLPNPSDAAEYPLPFRTD